MPEKQLGRFHLLIKPEDVARAFKRVDAPSNKLMPDALGKKIKPKVKQANPEIDTEVSPAAGDEQGSWWQKLIDMIRNLFGGGGGVGTAPPALSSVATWIQGLLGGGQDRTRPTGVTAADAEEAHKYVDAMKAVNDFVVGKRSGPPSQPETAGTPEESYALAASRYKKQDRRARSISPYKQGVGKYRLGLMNRLPDAANSTQADELTREIVTAELPGRNKLEEAQNVLTGMAIDASPEVLMSTILRRGKKYLQPFAGVGEGLFDVYASHDQAGLADRARSVYEAVGHSPRRAKAMADRIAYATPWSSSYDEGVIDDMGSTLSSYFRSTQPWYGVGESASKMMADAYRAKQYSDLTGTPMSEAFKGMRYARARNMLDQTDTNIGVGQHGDSNRLGLFESAVENIADPFGTNMWHNVGQATEAMYNPGILLDMYGATNEDLAAANAWNAQKRQQTDAMRNSMEARNIAATGRAYENIDQVPSELKRAPGWRDNVVKQPADTPESRIRQYKNPHQAIRALYGYETTTKPGILWNDNQTAWDAMPVNKQDAFAQQARPVHPEWFQWDDSTGRWVLRPNLNRDTQF